jgi:hypothetical protein
MFKAISRITDEEQGLTAGTIYTVVNTKHQSNINICIINDFGVHQRVNKKHFTITVDSEYNSKLNFVQHNVV